MAGLILRNYSPTSSTKSAKSGHRLLSFDHHYWLELLFLGLHADRSGGPFVL